METGLGGGGEVFRLAGAVVQRLTVGHRRLMGKMGFPLFREQQCGEVTADVAGEVKEAALMAAVWLATRPLLEVRPGGRVASAIQSGTHARLMEEWEFELDGSVMAQIPLAFAVAVELPVTTASVVPVVEPEPLPVGEVEVKVEVAAGAAPGVLGSEGDEECLSCQ